MGSVLRLRSKLRCHCIQQRVIPAGRLPYSGVSLLSRRCASQSTLGGQPTSSRKQVTVINDDGRVQWKDLSAREKTARTTQQTFNLGIILVGLIMTGGCASFLYREVFSTDSKTYHFNQAVDKIRADPRVREALGSDTKINAYGEPTSNRWARARPLMSALIKDEDGTDNCFMRFNVEGSARKGVINFHKSRAPGQHEWRYESLNLDIKGRQRIVLEGARIKEGSKNSNVNFLGMSLRR